MATTTVTRLDGYVAVQHGADCRDKLTQLKIFVAVQQILEVVTKFGMEARLLRKRPQPPRQGGGLGE